MNLQGHGDQQDPGSSEKLGKSPGYYRYLAPDVKHPVINVDSENYMFRGIGAGSDHLSRSLLLSGGSNYNRGHDDDLDMFMLKDVAGGPDTLAADGESNSYCARTLSFHSLLCSCSISCCCMCGSLCSPDCHACFHKCCVQFATNHACKPKKGFEGASGHVDQGKPVNDWTSCEVQTWMRSMNLYQYIEIFSIHDIKGCDLINVDLDTLRNMGIDDEYHQKAVLTSIGEVLSCHEDCSESSSAIPGITSEEKRCPHLTQHGFNTLERCARCNKYLRGLLHQGFVCQDCGLVAHRTCAATGLPSCIKSLFGQALCAQFNPSDLPAPTIVIKCIEALEIHARSNSSLELYNLYCVSAPIDQVNELREKLNEPTLNLDLTHYSAVCIANVFKKFLRELPDPIIPVQWYDKYLEAAKVKNDDQCLQLLKVLVQEIPENHKSTLRYVMAHLCRMCQMEHLRGNASPPTVLIQAMCHIFLRPPWERIIQVVYNTQAHNRIVELLLLNCDWGENLPEFAQAPAIPPRKVSRMGSSVSTSDKDKYGPHTLQEADWYWGNITRDEVNEKLNDSCDGTFLVRDASSKCGEYTLTLRKGGANKLIKICQKNGKYGFTEPYSYNSVVELVNHFRNDSLSQYNASLDIKLLYPVSKHNTTAEDEAAKKENIDKLVAHLMDVSEVLSDKNKLFDTLSEDFNKTTQEVLNKRQALDAFKELVKVFKEQTKTQEKFQSEAQPHEITDIMDNAEVLKRRLKVMEESCEQLDENLQQREAFNRSLEREITSLKPQIKNLMKERDKYHRYLIARGVKPGRIRQMLEKEGTHEDTTDNIEDCDLEMLPHNEEKTWLLLNCHRVDAEKLLANKPDGTFLVRKSSTNQYALSISCNGNVNHCIIFETKKGFGFAEPYNIYDSLKSLVLHYSQNSLEIHNDSLNTNLAIPIFASRSKENQWYGHSSYVP